MIFSILTIIVCVLLVLVILVQNSKGGGIQSQFGAATQIMGVKRGTEFIEKATWGLAISLILLTIFMAPKSTATAVQESSGSKVKEAAGRAIPMPASSQQAPAPSQQPAGAQPAPTQPGQQ